MKTLFLIFIFFTFFASFLFTQEADLVNRDIITISNSNNERYLVNHVDPQRSREAYQLDDGSSESMIGMGIASDFMVLNGFEAIAGLETIGYISIAWGTPGASTPSGHPVRLILYDDPTNDWDPSDAVYLTESVTNIIDPDTDIFTTVTIPSTIVSGVFYIASLYENTTGFYPCSLDQTFSQGSSWYVCTLSPGTFDVNNIDNPSYDYPLDTIDNYGFPGNWLLRAVPVYNGPVWHVSTTGSDITGNGTEQYPFATIQHGINVSANTDTVLVQPGTYVENINYNGKLITVASLFLTTADPAYISLTTIDGNNSGRVVTFTYVVDSTAVLSGFTITNGYTEFGGGIYCDNASRPSLQNVTITGNYAEYGGGIFCVNSSSLSLTNVTIMGNTAYYGGGILCWDSSPSLENVTISDNFSNWDGGGIYCYYSNPNLENVTISGNDATFSGGGIYCELYSNPSLNNVTISSNFAGTSGGGISCYDSSPSLENVTITSNMSSGIYLCDDSNPVLINSILWNDSPQEIYNIGSGSVTATYSDIEGGTGQPWFGTGCIDSNPLFVDPSSEDYLLQPTSPCIDAGDPASPLDPDGTIADMGAYYFDQTIAPDPPQNVTIEIIGTDVHLSWDAVTGANSYKVYSSDDPYTGFVEDTSGSFTGESWSAPIGDVKKIYYVIASTETIRSKDSDLQDAYHPGRRSRRYDSDKFINRKK